MTLVDQEDRLFPKLPQRVWIESASVGFWACHHVGLGEPFRHWRLRRAAAQRKIEAIAGREMFDGYMPALARSHAGEDA